MKSGISILMGKRFRLMNTISFLFLTLLPGTAVLMAQLIPEPERNPLTRLSARMNQAGRQLPEQITAAADLLPKFDSATQELIADYFSGMDAATAARAANFRMSPEECVLVDIYISSGDLQGVAAELRAAAMEVTGIDSLFMRVSGFLPIGAALDLARRSDVKSILSVRGIGSDVGSVMSQGDAAHNGPAARALGYDGIGVKVGIISTSMNQVGGKVAASQASGDIPAGAGAITIQSDDVNGVDEGRAMAEVIYDTAPGITQFYFGTGTLSAPAKAAAIDALANVGVRIIADDVFYLTEPFFQDGPIAQAVDRASLKGIAYFASAGNRARQSYESYFVSSAGGFHDFDPGVGVDQTQTITTIPSGAAIYISFQWDDPWGTATNDYDIRLQNATTSSLLASGATNNILTGIPREEVYWANGTGSPVAVEISIKRMAGSSNSFLKYIARGFNMNVINIAEYPTNSDTINPDAAAAEGSIAVAAVGWNQAGLNSPQSYSSRGPKTRLFDVHGVRFPNPRVLQKPLIAGADCVATSATYASGLQFGGVSGFCGTSASVASVVGIAALMVSAKPQLTAPFIQNILANSANTIDCTASGNPDSDCGYGFVKADNAVAAAIATTPRWFYFPIVAK